MLARIIHADSESVTMAAFADRTESQLLGTEKAPDEDSAYAALLRRFPRLSCFDSRGTYCGPVAYENGWTP